MASGVDLQRVVQGAVAVVSSAGLLWLGTGLHPVWWITWLAPLPVLIVAPRLSGKATTLVALLSWAVSGFNMWHYFRALLHIPLTVILMILLAPAFVFALVVLAFRGLVLRRRVGLAVVGFPALWASYEYLNAMSSPHSTFGNVAYSQMDFLPVVQIASVTGIWGISFCLFLFAAAIAVLVSGQGKPRQRAAIASVAAVFFLSVAGFGVWRLRSAHAAPEVTVGLVASDIPQNILTEDRSDTLRLLRDYAAQVDALAAKGAQVVVTPEKIGVVLDSYLAETDTLFAATRARPNVVLGLIHPTTGAKWNEARWYSNGTVLSYGKHHMLPAVESSFTVGTARTEVEEASGKWGVAICKDMDFPRLSREYGEDGVGLLLVPAWDFAADGWLHGRMAILRGVEAGFSIARAPKQGILTVTDDRGRVLAEQPTDAVPFATLLTRVPVRHEATIYSRYGDWFAWLSLGIGVMGVAGLVLRRSQVRSDSFRVVPS
jgi:apolipoprotein N-acyltransferase